ncbi:MAG: hypothetical protein M4579_000668 [Chaenotheca gracillima]|nr:MAG: hypothetical protein M4579_000668 [Chaenotheca gracillima]
MHPDREAMLRAGPGPEEDEAPLPGPPGPPFPAYRPPNRPARYWNRGKARGKKRARPFYRARHPRPASEEAGSSRTYAPGLAVQKARVDPYDPDSVLIPEDQYTLLQKKEDASVLGTWTTIDPRDQTRTYDGKWHEEQNVWEMPRAHSGNQVRGSYGPSSRHLDESTHPSPNLKPRPIAADQDWFQRTSGQKQEETNWDSEFRFAPDERFEDTALDIDPDVRGRIYSEEPTAQEIARWERDHGEPSHEDGYQTERESPTNPYSNLSLNRSSIPPPRSEFRESFERTSSIVSRRPGPRARLAISSAERTIKEESVDLNNEDSLFMPLETTSEEARSPGDRPPPPIPVEDIEASLDATQDDVKSRLFEHTKKACMTLGRVVIVQLHQPVHYSIEAMMSRIFAGVVQEVQFNHTQRAARVVFAFPGEAKAFLTHNKVMCDHEPDHYRDQQIDVDWVEGDEKRSVAFIQTNVHMLVIDKDARRALLMDKISLNVRKEDLFEEMRAALGKVLVKVSLIRDSRRYVRERDGNQAILEFVSIKDAFEAKTALEEGRIYQFQHHKVSWAKDPCDRYPPKSQHCFCVGCLHRHP